MGVLAEPLAGSGFVDEDHVAKSCAAKCLRLHGPRPSTGVMSFIVRVLRLGVRAHDVRGGPFRPSIEYA